MVKMSWGLQQREELRLEEEQEGEAHIPSWGNRMCRWPMAEGSLDGWKEKQMQYKREWAHHLELVSPEGNEKLLRSF